MKVDVTQLQYLMDRSTSVKTILIQRHGVPIIFIIRSNMS